MSTLEERKQAYEAKVLVENEPKQWKAAFKRQEELGFDSNFMSMLSGILSACSIAGVDKPLKAAECEEVLDELWAEKYRRSEEGDLNLDYSDYGPLPYSYTEVRLESQTP